MLFFRHNSKEEMCLRRDWSHVSSLWQVLMERDQVEQLETLWSLATLFTGLNSISGNDAFRFNFDLYMYAAVWLKLVLWGRLRTGQLRGRSWWYEHIFLFIFWVNLTELLNEMMDNISGGRNKVARQQINKAIGLKAARKQNKLKWINEDVSVSSCSLSVCRSKNETRSLNLYRWRTSVCSSHVEKLLLIIYM